MAYDRAAISEKGIEAATNFHLAEYAEELGEKQRGKGWGGRMEEQKGRVDQWPVLSWSAHRTPTPSTPIPAPPLRPSPVCRGPEARHHHAC